MINIHRPQKNKFRKFRPTGLLLLATVFTAIISQPASGQPYSFKRYQTPDGLSNNTVLGVVQDSLGFIWMSTGDSLCRFDGNHFKNYFPATGAPTDYIASQTTDPAGKVWIGTASGIFYYNAQKDNLDPFLDTLKAIASLLFDREANLWVIAQGKLYRFSFRTLHLSQVQLPQNQKVTTICKGANTIWAGNNKGQLFTINPHTLQYNKYNIFSEPHPTGPTSIKKILPLADSALLIGTDAKGLKKFNIRESATKNVLDLKNYGHYMYVADILQRTRHEFWLATFSGIVIYNDSLQTSQNIEKKFNNPYNLSDNNCYCVYMDKEGGIWIGTYFGGVNYYNPHGISKFKNFVPDNAPGSISGQAVRDIYGDPNGNIWINTEDAGLNKLNPRTGKIIQIKENSNNGTLSYKNVQGLTVFNGHLWIGTYQHGIDVIDTANFKLIKHYDSKTTDLGLKDDWITCIYQTPSRQLFIGTSNRLYQYLQPLDKFVEIPLEGPSENNFINCILSDHNHLWVGTSKGLYKINIKNRHTDKPNSLLELPFHDPITTLYLDDNNKVWVCGGSTGLYYIDKDTDTLQKFNNKGSVNKMKDAFIFSMLEDNRQHYWISSTKGLWQYFPQKDSFANYTIHDGLPTNEFYFYSSYKDPQGNLYFGSTNGMVKFNPADFHHKYPSAALMITGFQVDNKDASIGPSPAILQKSISITDTIHLNYKQNSFNIEFAALGFASPSSTKYQYKLSGMQEKWTQLKANRAAYFTNVSPGTYTFRVRAFPKGYLPSKERKLSIIISPPFWQTPLAYILYGLTTIFFTGIIIYYYKIRLQLKKDRELHHSKMTFYTNIAHEIKSPLSLIKGPLENLTESIDQYPDIQEDVILMQKSSSRLINLVNQLLDFRKTEAQAIEMNAKLVNLSAILKGIYERHKNVKQYADLHCQLSLPSRDAYIKTDREALEKIIVNLITNALKFSRSKVEISLAKHPGPSKQLYLKIKNDGTIIPDHAKELIFQPFYRLPETANVAGTGIGLALSKNLAELLNFDLWLAAPEDNMNVFILSIPQ